MGRAAGGAQAAARDAAADAKLEGRVVFRDVGDNCARTGIHVSIVDGDEVSRELDGFAGAGGCRRRRDGGEGRDDVVERGGLWAGLREQTLKVEGERHDGCSVAMT